MKSRKQQAWNPCLVYRLLLTACLAIWEVTGSSSLPGQPPPRRHVIHYIEKELFIPDPLAFPNGLDAIEVYATESNQHPLAVLTHGTSPIEEERERVTPWSELGQAMWFARRGYVAIVVVRRGYGRSGGERDGSAGGCRSHTGSFRDAGEASADDLRAAIRYAQSLPEVDPEQVISVGVSTGGFAQAALSADPPAGLKAAINFAGGRGGDGHEHDCDLNALIASYGFFGGSAHKHGDLPMLWIYSQNDHWFPPEMARLFQSAYAKRGGQIQFVLAPPDGEDGHYLYSHPAAWPQAVDQFLNDGGLLPLGSELLPEPQPAADPAPPGLDGRGQGAWREYLLGAPYKAFSSNGQGAWGMSRAAFSQAIADAGAVERCKKIAAAGTYCSIAARTPGVD